MPDSITIAGIGLRLTRFTERARAFRGEIVESFDNTLMDGRDKPRRVWEGETDSVTPIVEEALRAAIANGAVMCEGLVLYGETVTAIVVIESANRGPSMSSGRPDWTSVNSVLTLTLMEHAAAPSETLEEMYVMESGAWVPVTSGTIP